MDTNNLTKKESYEKEIGEAVKKNNVSRKKDEIEKAKQGGNEG
jgi:hypothetical protein